MTILTVDQRNDLLQSATIVLNDPNATSDQKVTALTNLFKYLMVI